MTVRRTEIPVQGARPKKPSLDIMGPGTDRETPMPQTPSKTRPHAPSLKETHEHDFIPVPRGQAPHPALLRRQAGQPGRAGEAEEVGAA